MEYQDEELRQLFKQLPVENPSKGFSSRVMEQVVLERQRVEKQQRIHRIFWWIVAGCFAIVALIFGLSLVHHYYDLRGIQDIFGPLLISFGDTFSSTTSFLTEVLNSKALLIGVVFLALLLGDLFIRHAIEQKKATE